MVQIPMRLTALSTASAAGLLAVGLMLSPSAAQAQVGSARDSVAGSSNRHQVAPQPQKPPAPPALPGAQSSGAAPPNRIPLDMPPNEALFDGVNRGDIGAVRDALSRGADLKAHNILGITATELAIDLGKNDIAFLLLSMRGADRPRGSARGQQAASSPFAGGDSPRPTRAGSQRVAAERPAPPPRTAAPKPQPDYARQYANDGGAPAPSAGFLGFDERRTSR